MQFDRAGTIKKGTLIMLIVRNCGGHVQERAYEKPFNHLSRPFRRVFEVSLLARLLQRGLAPCSDVWTLESKVLDVK